MEQWMWIIWLVVFVLALVIEAIGTDLVSIWFAAGAVVAIILSLIPEVPWEPPGFVPSLAQGQGHAKVSVRFSVLPPSASGRMYVMLRA